MATESRTESQEQDQSQSTQQSSNDFVLIPYAQVDGEWTLPDHFIKAAFQQMRTEGTASAVFYENTITTDEEFIEVMKRPRNVVVFVLRGTELYGVAWLNGWQKTYAFGHFCLMQAAIKEEKTVEIGKCIRDYWLSFPSVDFVLGVIPGFNKTAIKFAQEVGFKMVGSIPKMLEWQAGKTDAVILYLTQDG